MRSGLTHKNLELAIVAGKIWQKFKRNLFHIFSRRVHAIFIVFFFVFNRQFFVLIWRSVHFSSSKPFNCSNIHFLVKACKFFLHEYGCLGSQRLYSHLFLSSQCGVKNIRRAASLNDSPVFIRALADLVHSHLKEGKTSTKQLTLRCPMCVNPTCGKMRDLFARQTL